MSWELRQCRKPELKPHLEACEGTIACFRASSCLASELASKMRSSELRSQQRAYENCHVQLTAQDKQAEAQVSGLMADAS